MLTNSSENINVVPTKRSEMAYGDKVLEFASALQKELDKPYVGDANDTDSPERINYEAQQWLYLFGQNFARTIVLKSEDDFNVFKTAFDNAAAAFKMHEPLPVDRTVDTVSAERRGIDPVTYEQIITQYIAGYNTTTPEADPTAFARIVMALTINMMQSLNYTSTDTFEDICEIYSSILSEACFSGVFKA